MKNIQSVYKNNFNYIIYIKTWNQSFINKEKLRQRADLGLVVFNIFMDETKNVTEMWICNDITDREEKFHGILKIWNEELTKDGDIKLNLNKI